MSAPSPWWRMLASGHFPILRARLDVESLVGVGPISAQPTPKMISSLDFWEQLLLSA